jgi:plastocyanin
MEATTATTNPRLPIVFMLVGGLAFACMPPPAALPAAPTATALIQESRVLTLTSVPSTIAPLPGFTPEVTQRDSAGVPLPAAPGAVNVVVTYTPVPTGAPAPKSGLIPVSVGDNYFYPEEVHMTAGSTVEWDYNGGGGETESIHNVIALDQSFSSGDLNPNSRFAYTFEQPGEVDYVCSYHARQMTGKVLVQ